MWPVGRAHFHVPLTLTDTVVRTWDGEYKKLLCNTLTEKQTPSDALCKTRSPKAVLQALRRGYDPHDPHNVKKDADCG